MTAESEAYLNYLKSACEHYGWRGLRRVDISTGEPKLKSPGLAESTNTSKKLLVKGEDDPLICIGQPPELE